MICSKLRLSRRLKINQKSVDNGKVMDQKDVGEILTKERLEKPPGLLNF